jgi:hypothetical protein
MAKCMQCGGSTKMKKMQKGGSTGIVGMPKYGNNPRTDEGRVFKQGGSFAPNRAVQSSCKGGMVRDENGRCVMERKMAKGGSSFGMLSVKAGIDKNPSPTQADRIAGATKKMKEGGNWIAGAIKRPGAFSAKAKAAGMSTSAYAAKVTKPGSKASTRTKRQANLAKTLGKMHKK